MGPNRTAGRGDGGARGARARARGGDVLALVLLWVVLLVPHRLDQLRPIAFLRLPVELIVLAALALVLPRRTSRVTATVVGVALGLLAVLRVVELGFVEVLDRPFNPVTDVAHLGPAFDFVRASFGGPAAVATVVGAVLLAVALVLGVTLAVRRLALAVRHRRRTWSLAAAAVLVAAWLALAVTGVHVGGAEPVASSDAVRFAVGEARSVAGGLRDQRRFDAAVRVDAYRQARPGDLAGLEGKDVLVTFVESYGRVAVEGTQSAGVRATLDDGTRRLEAAGFAARSAFLTSPTFGGVSWLAHSTLQSGVWVDNPSSYDRLLAGDRTTLTSVFGRAGWRTVALLPSNRSAWPEGQRFYHFDTVYDRSGLGYAGPGFGFSAMPDQFALEAFRRRELGPDGRAPVMAEVELASSHGPWAPVPRMVSWAGLGDGSQFDAVQRDAESASELWSHREQVPAAYMASIEYSLTALITFVERYGDDRLVLVVGDHQPATIVSGFGGNRDVPVTVVARDPAVAAQVAGWGWQRGLRPGPDAPVWRMDSFRDRFLDAFSRRGARESAGDPAVVPATVPSPHAAVPGHEPTR